MRWTTAKGEFRDYISRKQERGVVFRAIIPLGMHGRQGNAWKMYDNRVENKNKIKRGELELRVNFRGEGGGEERESEGEYLIKLLKLWPSNGGLMKWAIFKINFGITPGGILRLKFCETSRENFFSLDDCSLIIHYIGEFLFRPTVLRGWFILIYLFGLTFLSINY